MHAQTMRHHRHSWHGDACMVCTLAGYCAVRLLREELQLLQEPGSYVGEVVKVMGKTKVLCKVHPEGKYVVDLDKVSCLLAFAGLRRVSALILHPAFDIVIYMALRA